MNRWLPRIFLTLAFVAGVSTLAFDRWIEATILPSLHPETSRSILDRDGVLLRAYPVADGRWRLPIDLTKTDPNYIAQLIAFEDKRFYSHPGIDPLAILRATSQAVWNGHIVSGGSTLTMQTARLLEDGETGTITGKLRQIRVALALERHLTKGEILTLYLQLAPFGGNIEGIRSASLTWFGKEPRRLTPAEAALLVALPQSPETRRPDRYLGAAILARNHVINRSVIAGVLAKDEAQAALLETIAPNRMPFPILAPHLADRLLLANTNNTITTTLDAQLQSDLETLVRDTANHLDPRLSAAIIVADYTTGDILAEIGSPDYTSTARLGFVDMTRAIRSPGSTLKPLIYGLAFEAGIAHPETLLDDRPTTFGTYAPQNFDRTYRGTITAREALQLSVNIPAVALLDAIGPAQLLARLKRAGITPVLPENRAPGLAIGLGGLGLSLHDLVTLYAAIANGGQTIALYTQPAQPEIGETILHENAAWQVADILSGVPPPPNAAAGQLAYKTGTSYGHRDAWAIGFDGQHVIGVWLGRADGAAMPGALGAELAAPLLFEAFARLKPDRIPLPAPPKSVLTLANAELPRHLQHFIAPGATLTAQNLQIDFPPDGAKLDMSTAPDLLLKARNGQLPLTWIVNGQPLPPNPFARTALWSKLGKGFAQISVVDSLGNAARANVFLQ